MNKLANDIVEILHIFKKLNLYSEKMKHGGNDSC